MTFSILILGDVVGRPGRKMIAEKLPALRESLNLNFVVTNAENSAGGFGIDTKCANELWAAGVDVITLGDHTWKRPSVKKLFEEYPSKIIRPNNFIGDLPGSGKTTREVDGRQIIVCNLMGRVFIDCELDCPFQQADQLLPTNLDDSLCLVDFHAEATSEKIAFGRYVDGRASFVGGTHTHVQTSDLQRFPNGTNFLCDIGMSGPAEGVLGMSAERSIARFTNGKSAYSLQTGKRELQGVLLRFSDHSNFAEECFRFRCSEDSYLLQNATKSEITAFVDNSLNQTSIRTTILSAK